jgi:hypothetical protein
MRSRLPSRLRLPWVVAVTVAVLGHVKAKRLRAVAFGEP